MAVWIFIAAPDHVVGLTEVSRAIIACADVIAGGMPILAWAAAALSMVIYAMRCPERYDIAYGVFAFTLIVTLAATGEHRHPCSPRRPGKR